MGPDEIWRRYGIILANRGLASATGVPKVRKIRELIRVFFPAELLERLGCPVKDDHDWIDKVLSQKSTLPPIYHILLLRFLGISLEQLFFQDWKLKPFGDGPWPCFNPVAHSHKYEALTIEEVNIEIKIHPKKKLKRVIGIFSCQCGFSYFLLGATQMSKRQPKIQYVLSRGEDWDQELRSAWNDPDVGNYDLRIKFRLHWRYLLVEARRLDLAVRRTGKPKSTYITSKETKTVSAPPVNEEAVYSAEANEKMREEWLQLRKDYPNHNIMKLIELKPALHNRLYIHDKEWLDQNNPPRLATTLNWTEAEYREVDAEIAAIIRETATRLKAPSKPPKRVTAAAILKSMGKYWFAYRHKIHLPITWETAQQLAETDEEWTERKGAYHSHQG